MEMKPRKQWIDFLRGIAMLLVIWGHIDRSVDLYFLITSPFKMPLFFAITGYVFNDRNGDVKGFFKNLFFRIIVPWFILSLVWLSIIIAIVKGRPDRIGNILYSFFSGEEFWFMPCIIVAQIIFFFIRKCIKQEKIQYIVMAAVSVAGILMTKAGIGRFALVDVACTAQIFILFGYWFRKREEKLVSSLSTAKIILLTAIYAGLIVLSNFIYPGERMDVHTNTYYSYWLCALLIFISLLIWFTASQKIKKYPRWLIFVGQNTLVFYIVHSHLRSALSRGLKIAGISLPEGIPGSIITMIIVCAALSVIAVIINKWLPFAAGKSRKRSVKGE